MPFEIVRNDITKMSVDAIVNTANEEPIYSTGVDLAIYKAAGEKKLLAEREKAANQSQYVLIIYYRDRYRRSDMKQHVEGNSVHSLAKAGHILYHSKMSGA